eukprot:TRINITY_DN426_c4_g1_i1.p1 TRINITY_DN426_c4_g1~~TRINITY_DN426_c4_g1_i1.p1  ORF type:complete len:658 (-),score=204.28 TRINITY_DN426_c4_g1_i1:111-2084(-)
MAFWGGKDGKGFGKDDGWAMSGKGKDGMDAWQGDGGKGGKGGWSPYGAGGQGDAWCKGGKDDSWMKGGKDDAWTKGGKDDGWAKSGPSHVPGGKDGWSFNGGKGGAKDASADGKGGKDAGMASADAWSDGGKGGKDAKGDAWGDAWAKGGKDASWGKGGKDDGLMKGGGCESWDGKGCWGGGDAWGKGGDGKADGWDGGKGKDWGGDAWKGKGWNGGGGDDWSGKGGKPRGQALMVKFAGREGTPSENVYVSGLPTNVDSPALQTMLEASGFMVQRLRIIPDTTNSGSSAAMVQMGSVEVASAFIEKFNGRFVEMVGDPGQGGGGGGGGEKGGDGKGAGCTGDDGKGKGWKGDDGKGWGMDGMGKGDAGKGDGGKDVGQGEKGGWGKAAAKEDAWGPYQTSSDDFMETMFNMMAEFMGGWSDDSWSDASEKDKKGKGDKPKGKGKGKRDKDKDKGDKSVDKGPKNCTQIVVDYIGKDHLPSDNLYLMNLPAATSDQALKEMFNSQGYTVTQLKVIADTQGRGVCAAMVRLTSQAEAAMAIEAFNGKTITVEGEGGAAGAEAAPAASAPSGPPRPLQLKFTGNPPIPSEHLYITGLPSVLDSATLQKMFTDAGFAVVRAKIVPDQWGTGYSAGMATLSTTEQAQAAIEHFTGQVIQLE